MLILLQHLYIFRSLPIPVPLSFFTSLQTILGKYVWQKSKARSSWSNLMKHRSVGGAGYIHFRDYLCTTQSLVYLYPLWSLVRNYIFADPGSGFEGMAHQKTTTDAKQHGHFPHYHGHSGGLYLLYLQGF